MKTTVVSVEGRAIARMAALAITLAASAGCGQKGPLTLPARQGAASVPTPAGDSPKGPQGAIAK